MEWYTWVFGGIGVPAIIYLYKKLLNRNNKNKTSNNIQTIKNNLVVSIGESFKKNIEKGKSKSKNISIEFEQYKKLINILFIDDDTKFKVVNILKTSGWINTKSIKDVKSLDAIEIKNAHVFFVDINGVGSYLKFKDEGLGLASALKEKYPLKKVVIYSAESQGDRFHDALKKADSFLSKNADPYEFQSLVEQFCEEIKL